jgi:hypothetical protein
VSDAIRVVTMTEDDLAALVERAALRAIDLVLARHGGANHAAPECVSIKQFALKRGVSEMTIRRMIQDGLPTERHGRRGVRIPLDKADTWFANRPRPRSQT